MWPYRGGGVALILIARRRTLGSGWELSKGKVLVSAHNREQMQNETNWAGMMDTEN